MDTKYLAVARKLAAWGWSYDSISKDIEKGETVIFVEFLSEVKIDHGRVYFYNKNSRLAIIISKTSAHIFLN